MRVLLAGNDVATRCGCQVHCQVHHQHSTNNESDTKYLDKVERFTKKQDASDSHHCGAGPSPDRISNSDFEVLERLSKQVESEHIGRQHENCGQDFCNTFRARKERCCYHFYENCRCQEEPCHG